MLTTRESNQILKELIMKLPPTLMTEEAQAYRAEVSAELIEMERDGIVPELSYDLSDDDDPLPLTAAPDPGPLDPTATTLIGIRRNMTIDERLWLGQMIEAHGEAEVIRMWPSLIVQLEFSRSL